MQAVKSGKGDTLAEGVVGESFASVQFRLFPKEMLGSETGCIGPSFWASFLLISLQEVLLSLLGFGI